MELQICNYHLGKQAFCSASLNACSQRDRTPRDRKKSSCKIFPIAKNNVMKSPPSQDGTRWTTFFTFLLNESFKRSLDARSWHFFI